MSGTFGTDRLGLAQRRKVLQRQECAECLNRAGHGQVGQGQPARAQTDRWPPVGASSGYRRPRQTHERQLVPPIELRFRPVAVVGSDGCTTSFAAVAVGRRPLTYSSYCHQAVVALTEKPWLKCQVYEVQRSRARKRRLTPLQRPLVYRSNSRLRLIAAHLSGRKWKLARAVGEQSR